MFIVQECWNSGHIFTESTHDVDETEAIAIAKRTLGNPIFEADYVRVLSLDCELVFDSRNLADRGEGSLTARYL